MSVHRLKCLITNVREHDSGQDLLEYALLASLISVVAIGAVDTLGQTIKTHFWEAIAAAAALI
jgi:Flp pilus assembly pilin Flp